MSRELEDQVPRFFAAPPTVDSVELKIDKPMRIIAFLARTSIRFWKKKKSYPQAEYQMVFEF